MRNRDKALKKKDPTFVITLFYPGISGAYPCFDILRGVHVFACRHLVVLLCRVYLIRYDTNMVTIPSLTMKFVIEFGLFETF